MRFLWKDVGALSYAGSDKSSHKRTPIERRRNLQKFYEYARRYEASSYKGLHDFVEYVSGIISQNTKIAQEDAVTDNTVRIMTVHKSKGLEFPAVFLIGCAKSTDSGDSRTNMVFEPSCDVALAFKVSDSTGFGQLDTPFRIALTNKASSLSSEEEIRVLYVALTRARDRLCIVASGKEDNSEKCLTEAFRRASLGGRSTVLSSSSWIKRILLGLAADPSANSYEIKTPLITEDSAAEDNSAEEYVPNEEEIEHIYSIIKPALEFEYLNSNNSMIPAKVSVSRLYPEMLNETEDSYDISKKIEAMEPRKPRFMGGGDDSAEKGTATHLFMQFCDFSRLTPKESSVKEEISRLIEKRFLPNNIADLIRAKEIATFAASEFFNKILSAHKIYRELRFNVFLSAEDFTDIADRKLLFEGEKILVQGVIDLCIEDEDGNLILCDYKTDRLSREALNDRIIAKQILSDRHSQQLKYYAQAIEQIMGKKPDKIYIYSLAFGDAIEIDV
jgi:ATP-dependent helicase/nuclease subunit A